MRRADSRWRVGAISCALLYFMISSGVNIATAQVVREDDPALRNIDILEHLGQSVPGDVVITDDRGRTATLGEMLADGKPTILIMAYYTCPMLCNLVLNGVVTAANELAWTPGEEYRIVTVSIDPTETPELAAAKKINYLASMTKAIPEDGWLFCTASADQSRRLAEAIGFQYYYDEELKQYAHAAVITILTGDETISRYLYGIEFKTRDVKLALLEASEGRIGDTFDRILLYCYHYDPDRGGYAVFAVNVMKLGGVATIAALLVFLGLMWFREYRRRATAREHRV